MLYFMADADPTPRLRVNQEETDASSIASDSGTHLIPASNAGGARASTASAASGASCAP